MFLAIRKVFALYFRDVVCALLLKQSIRACLIPEHLWDPTVRGDVVFCSTCIQIAYKDHELLWQMVARHWVLVYPTVTSRENI